MEQITLRLPVRLLAELEREARNRDRTRSEHIRDVLASRRNTRELEEQLAQRERRIEYLESQLAERTRVEDKVDDLVAREEGRVDAPWPISIWQWWRERGD